MIAAMRAQFFNLQSRRPSVPLIRANAATPDCNFSLMILEPHQTGKTRIVIVEGDTCTEIEKRILPRISGSLKNVNGTAAALIKKS